MVIEKHFRKKEKTKKQRIEQRISVTAAVFSFDLRQSDGDSKTSNFCH